MPKKPTLDEITKSRLVLQKELDDYDDTRKKFVTRIDKTMMEYGIIRKGLEEGHDEINALKDSLKAAFVTWGKMFDKLDAIKDKLGDVAKDVKKSRPGLDKFDDAATELSKALAGCAGDVSDMKAENAELAKVKKVAARLITDFQDLADQSGAPPKDPPKPTP